MNQKDTFLIAIFDITKKTKYILSIHFLHLYVPNKTVTHIHHNQVAASIGNISTSLYCALAWGHKTEGVFVVLNFPFIENDAVHP